MAAFSFASPPRALSKPVWLLVAVLALTGCARRSAEVEPPAIRFEGTVHDFGEVEQGVAVSHEFGFRNTGGRALVIDEARSACGCTAAVAPISEIDAGGSGAITASFDTSSSFGEQIRSITVYSNDPARPVTTLTIRAEIAADAAAEPDQLYLGRLRRGEAARRGFRVVLGRDDVVVESIESSGNVLAVRTRSRRGSGKSEVTVAVRSDAPLGPFREEVVIHTTSARAPTVVVPVAGRVEGDVTVSPARLSFGVVDAGREVAQVVQVRNAGSKPVHLAAGPGTSAWMRVQVETIRDGYEYLLTMSLNPPRAAGQLRGRVEITTDHPEQMVLSIPIRARVRSE